MFIVLSFTVFLKSSKCINSFNFKKGSRKEKLAMLETKCRPQQQSTPDLSEDDPQCTGEYFNPEKISSRKGPPIRRTHSDDIKERVQLLEKAINNTKYNSNDTRLDKNDPEYGRPLKGTWTAERGVKAHNHVHKVCFDGL